MQRLAPTDAEEEDQIMWTAIRRHAKPATANAPAAAIRPAPPPQTARSAPPHDLSRVPIAPVAQRKPAPGANARSYRAPNRAGRLEAVVEPASGLGGGPVAGARAVSTNVVQRKVDVGGTLYKPNDKTGHTPNDLVRKVAEEAKAKSVTLRKGWQTDARAEAKDKTKTTSYTNWDAIIDAFKSLSSGAKKRARLDEQDRVITGLLTGVDEPTKKRARTIAYESKKASKSVSKYIQSTDEFKRTKAELEALPAADIGSDEVSETTIPAYVFEALGQSNTMKRVAFDFHGVPIYTYAYETAGDRSVDASTLGPFGYGPIRIGDDIGAYRGALKKGADIRGPANNTLTDLEIKRVPQTSAMVALKRDLYAQGQTSLSEAIAIDSRMSNVEFSGAVSGSGLRVDEAARMRQQQVFSNAHILEDSATRFPNFEIGSQTADRKKRTTPKEIKDALDLLRATKDRDTKKALRRKLKRLLASVRKIEDYDSGSDVSDYDSDDYKS